MAHPHQGKEPNHCSAVTAVLCTAPQVLDAQLVSWALVVSNTPDGAEQPHLTGPI